MTLSEAIRRQALRLTRTEWNEYAHIELAPVGDGYGSSVTLRDVASRRQENEQQVSVLQIQPDGWKVWEPPEDVARFIPSWPTYEKEPA